MLVSHCWPKCDYQDGEWGCTPQDAFFVGFTLEELRHWAWALVLPPNTLTDEYFDEHKSPTQMAGVPLESAANRLWFLIARDLSFVNPFPWYYPISNQWNGASPLVSMSKEYGVEVDDLKKLKKLKAPK